MAKVATSRSLAASGSDDKGGNVVRNWWDQSVGFLRDVRNEMRKVTTPSLKEVQATTGVVIVTVALFAIYFYGVDRVLGFLIDHLLAWAKNA
jgi:preprotein translocase subunit SecE